MRKLNNKEKSLVIAVGILLVIFMLKVFIFGPIYEKITAYSREIEQLKMAIRRYVALEHNRTEILKAQAQIQGYSILKGSDEERISIVMSKVEAQARKAKLQILDMSPAGSLRMKGGVTVYRVQLRAEGQLKNVLDFVSGVENADILAQVDKISLTPKEEAGSVLKVEVVASGISFS